MFGFKNGDMAQIEAGLREQSRRHRALLGIDPADSTANSDSAITAASPFALGPYSLWVGRDVPEETETLPYEVELEGPDLEVPFNPAGHRVLRASTAGCTASARRL